MANAPSREWIREVFADYIGGGLSERDFKIFLAQYSAKLREEKANGNETETH